MDTCHHHDLPLAASSCVSRKDFHGLSLTAAAIASAGRQFLSAYFIDKRAEAGLRIAFREVASQVEQAHHRIEVLIGLRAHGSATKRVSLQARG